MSMSKVICYFDSLRRSVKHQQQKTAV